MKGIIIAITVVCVIILLYVVFMKVYVKGHTKEFLVVPPEHLQKTLTPFNPSVYFDGEFNHVIIRLGNLTAINMIYKNVLGYKSKSYVLYQKMNETLDEIYNSHIIDINTPNGSTFDGMEDARIILWNGSYYLYGSYSTNKNKINIILVKLDNNFKSCEEYVLHCDSTQKNWIPIVYQVTNGDQVTNKDQVTNEDQVINGCGSKEELYFIKYADPFTLLKFDNDTKKIVTVYDESFLSNDEQKRDSNNSLAGVRGSSPTIFVNIDVNGINYKGYLCVTHTRNYISYKHQFLLLSNKFPFNCIWKSDNFMLDDINILGVEFCCGLTRINKDEVLVTFSRYDSNCKCKKYNLKNIFMNKFD